MNPAEAVPVPQTELLMLALGPVGALVIALAVAVALWRENKALQTALYNGEKQWQVKLDEAKSGLQVKLDEEKNVRLREALANAKAMEHWNDELHMTLKQLTGIAFHQSRSKGHDQM